MSVLLDIQHLVVNHHTGRFPFRRVLCAVNDVSFRVTAGERVAILGPSGCGKTSLIRAATGLYRRSAGTVVALGTDPALDRRPPSGVQILFQDAGASLHPRQSVLEAVEESARVHRPTVAGAALGALRAVDLEHRALAMPHELSGGEKRRVGLARLFLAQPRLTLADEPTAGLDAARKVDLLDLLLAQHDDSSALIVVTHDLAVARYACTRVLTMACGKLIADLPSDQIKSA